MAAVEQARPPLLVECVDEPVRNRPLGPLVRCVDAVAVAEAESTAKPTDSHPPEHESPPDEVQPNTLGPPPLACSRPVGPH